MSVISERLYLLGDMQIPPIIYYKTGIWVSVDCAMMQWLIGLSTYVT